MDGNFTLANFDKIDLSNSDRVNWEDAKKLSEERVKVIQQIHKEVPAIEQPFIQNEQQFLQQSEQFISSFANATHNFITEEQENIKKLEHELEVMRPELEEAQASLAKAEEERVAVQQKVAAAEQALDAANQEKIRIAETIKPADLAKITFKDFQDDSNNIFKWAIQVIYKETTANYEWNNFKKNAFVKDKGADFLARIKGLALSKLRRDDFGFGRNVIEKKEQYLGELEKKGKPNAALRNFLDYIEAVNKAGDQIEIIETANNDTEAHKTTAAQNKSKSDKIVEKSDILKMKIKASQHYVDTLSGLDKAYANLQTSIQERLKVQQHYLDVLQGDSKAAAALAEIQQQQQNREQKDVVYERQPTPIKAQATPENEEGIVGEKPVERAEQVQVESKYPVAPTDLKESEFAQSQKGSCESCNIF